MQCTVPRPGVYLVEIDCYRIQFEDVGSKKRLKLQSKTTTSTDRSNEGVVIPPADVARARSQAEAVRQNIAKRAPAIAEKKALVALHQGRLFN